jgi:predicted ribosomally synthesized peptide with SipW-like signal peptide
MRTKLWLILTAVAVMALGTLAGTFALFSANAASNNLFTSGTLTLDSYRDQGDTIPGPMFYTTPTEGQTPGGLPGLYPTGPWAPGDTNHRVLIVKATGSLDAWLTSVGASLDSGSMHLANALTYKVTTDSAGTNIIASGTLGALISGGDATFSTKVSAPVGIPKQLHFWVTLPLSADNSYQGETLRVTFHVNAVQKKNNP